MAIPDNFVPVFQVNMDSQLRQLSPFFIIFLYKTGNMMLDATIRPYVTTAVCREMFYPETTRCSSGSFDAGEEVIIHDRAALYLTYYRLALNIPCIVFGFLIGALSDRIGRKLPMTIPILGSLFSVSVYTCIRNFPQYTLVLFIVGTLIQGIACTSTVIKVTLNAYIVENTTPHKISRYLSILTAIGLLGQMVGSLLSGVLNDLIKVQYTLCVVSVVNVCTFILVIICINEHQPEEDEESFSMISVIEDVKQMLHILLRKRPGKSRCRFLMLLFEASTRSICFAAFANVTVLYIQGHPLCWPLSWYGYFTSAEQSAKTFGLLCIQPLFTKFCWTCDFTLLFVSFIFGLLQSIWTAFSTHTWMMWVASSMSCVNAVSTTTLRSLLSKEVEIHELGRMYAIVENLDIINRAATSTAYIAIYSSTIQYFPGMAYLIQAGANVVFAALTLFILRIKP